MNKQRGFTLLEVMITVTIVAILAATATFGYGHYAERANRTEAKSVLMDLAQRLERHYTDEGTYDGFTVPNSLAQVPTGEGRNATYSIDVSTSNQSFSITATPTGNQSKDKCGELGIDNVGRKTADGEGDCW